MIITVESVIGKYYKLGSMLSNRHGIVYELAEEPKKLLKIVKARWDKRDLKTIHKCLTDIQKANNPAIAKIYDVRYVTANKKRYLFYVMEKLKPIKLDGNVWEMLGKTVSKDAIPKHYLPKERRFVERVRKFNYAHADRHTGNLMQDHRGNYKFIDLESFSGFCC